VEQIISESSKFEIEPYTQYPSLYIIHDKDTSVPLLDEEIVRLIKKISSLVPTDSKFGSYCYDIATETVKKRFTSGCLLSYQDSNNFTGEGSLGHCLNYLYLEDGSIMSLDFTIRSYAINPSFEVLAVKARNIDELKIYLGEIYGGDWIEMEPRAVFNYKTTSYTPFDLSNIN